MVISHRHRFIFVKTAKTAGTSIEVFLSGVCGAEDVLTPFGRPEPGHDPRNHDGFYNHMPATEIRDKVGAETWRNYVTFCVERNPWDKTLSHYHFVNGRFHDGELSFDEFIDTGEFPVDHPRYTDGDAVIVDRILRYEQIDRELGSLFTELGVAWPGRLAPRAKGQYRTDRRPYRAVYTPGQRDRVAQAFAFEIEQLGYRY